FDVPRGLRLARRLLLDVLDLGLPVGCEFLEPISPQYIADTVSWGAIGARTTESQVHRQLASGLSMPIGFKNATDGNVQVAIDGGGAAAAPHVFFGSDVDGNTAVVRTRGNADAHLILRGGRAGSNYAADDIAAAREKLTKAGLPDRPIGFTTATDGYVQVAIDGCGAAAAPHVFFGSDVDGNTALVRTRGNADAHLILRGGRAGSNYAADDIAAAREKLTKAGLPDL